MCGINCCYVSISHSAIQIEYKIPTKNKQMDPKQTLNYLLKIPYRTSTISVRFEVSLYLYNIYKIYTSSERCHTLTCSKTM